MVRFNPFHVTLRFELSRETVIPLGATLGTEGRNKQILIYICEIVYVCLLNYTCTCEKWWLSILTKSVLII